MNDTILLWLIMIFAGAIMVILFVDWFIDCRKEYFSNERNDLIDSARKYQGERRIKEKIDWREGFKNDKY